MNYSLIKVINGNYFIHAEGITNIDSAKTTFHTLCATLWNAPDVATACVMIIDENLDTVNNYREFIYHASEPEAE